MREKFSWKTICLRHHSEEGGGGTVPTAETTKEEGIVAGNSEKDPAQAPVAPPPAAETYTKEQLEEAVNMALTKAKEAAESAQDYEKMTPEQKVQHLENQLKTQAIADTARGLIAQKGLPDGVLPFVSGDTREDTEAKITAFETMYTAAVKAGVEAEVNRRFKGLGHSPNLSTGNPTPPKGGASIQSAVYEALNGKIK